MWYIQGGYFIEEGNHFLKNYIPMNVYKNNFLYNYINRYETIFLILQFFIVKMLYVLKIFEKQHTFSISYF